MSTWIAGGLAILLAFVLVLLAFVALTYALRGTPVQRVRALHDRWGKFGADESDRSIDGISPYAPVSQTFCELSRVLTRTALSDGHRIRYFLSGDELYDVLLSDVARAERLVTWHVFWFKPGRLAQRVADALVERAQAGVQVMLLLDYYGSKGISSEYVERLRSAGVEVAVFRPPHWNSLYKAQHRMHIRAVVIDGRIGYSGGFAIDDHWLGDGRHAGQWRDTSVRIEGPAVDDLQGAFVSNWAEATGDLLLGEQVFDFRNSDLEDAPHTAGLLYSSPSLGSTSAERAFFMAITAARERCWLTSAYFVPNRYFRRLLCDAAARGVDVRVLTPGRNTDRPSTWYAARSHYEELIRGGIHLYEYRPTMVHAKTLVVDGIWSMVGTLNFDNRSMVLNDEVALLTWDRDLGAQLERAFRADLEHAEEITIERERERTTFVDRARMWGAMRISRLL